jgi:two-component system alkaline phosphatase synthesis response regulator PhoP/two-component system response regulator VicR
MPQTILVVDDEPQIARLVELNLARAGYAVRLASDGAEALVKIAEERPDLVVLDVMMPRLDGFETLRRIKADPSTADLRVIMLTARSQDEDVFEGYGRGAHWYLPKPFEPDELLTVVRLALAKEAGDATA